jgi:uncharacterized protein YggE
MPGIKEHAENSLTLNHPFARRGLKIGIGFLLVLAVLSSGLILQTSYAYTLEDLPLNLARYPLRSSQPDQYAIRVRPQTPTKEPLEIIENRNITVSARGQVNAQPDQAVIYVGVQTQAGNAKQALAENDSQTQDLLNALEENGVPTRDIQTQTLQPYRQVEGYMAANSVEITVHDLEQMERLLEVAVKRGGDIQDIQFVVSNPARHLNQARQVAIENAQYKAEQLVSLLDTELGEVLAVSETSQIPPPVKPEAPTSHRASGAPMEPGPQLLQVEVQVTWLLR